MLRRRCSCKRKERSCVSAKQNLPNSDHYILFSILINHHCKDSIYYYTSIARCPCTIATHHKSTPFGGVRRSQLEMAVLSKHEESNLRQSVEAWLRKKGYEIPVTGTGETCARYNGTEEATNFQAQEASKNNSDIIAIQVPNSSPPVFTPVKHN